MDKRNPGREHNLRRGAAPPPRAARDPHVSALHALAERAGLLVHWQDAQNRPQEVSPEVLRTLLGTLGLACADVRQCAASQAALDDEDEALGLAPQLTADQGEPLALTTARARALASRPYRLELEDGSVLAGTLTRDADGNAQLPGIGVIGYHRLLAGEMQATIAVAPWRCFGVGDALAVVTPAAERAAERTSERTAHGRPWGLSVQLYGLRRGVPLRPGQLGGLGDFTTLAECCGAAAREGAHAVAINPVHAGFAAAPERYSPYSPSSRLFRNPLYADPAATFGQAAMESAVAALNLGESLQALDARSEIDWPGVARTRLAVFRWLWDRRDTLLPAPVAQAFAAFRSAQGAPLQAHACFEALHAWQLAQATTAEQAAASADWRQWPQTLRSPAAAAVRAFALGHPEEIGYHAFLQFAAAEGLAAAQRQARDHGMAIGVVSDLAVGADPGGSQAWSWQDEMLAGVSAGAPPDIYNPRGQDWGIGVFSPRNLRRQGYAAFLAMLRANLDQVGGLRIDHALGLARIWLVPAGASPVQGAYLRFPMTDLLRLIALESWRHRAIIVGENLGTVPPTFNATLAGRGVLGIDVLWFERETPAAEPRKSAKSARPARSAGSKDQAADRATASKQAPAASTAPPAFLAPERWPADAVATTSTHDLPTVVGWWSGNDIAWRARLGQLAEGETEAAAMAARARDRTALWQALRAAGLCGHAGDREPDAGRAPLAAVLAWLGRTVTPLRLVPLEDLLGEREQPNLPGTISGHPNWQRRFDGDVRSALATPAARRHIAAVRTGELPSGDEPPEPASAL